VKITIISPDTVPLPIKETAPEFIEEDGKKFSLRDKCCRTTGLGKRAWRIAETLAKEENFDVTVLVPNYNYPGKEFIDEDRLLFNVESYNFKAAAWHWSEELDNRLKNSDFVIVQTAAGVAFKNCSVLPGNVNVIVDGFVPIFAELPCTILGRSSISRKILWDTFTEQYLGLITRANCVLYSNDRQYYYYEGQFFSIGKLSWKAFKFSPLLKVPCGVDINKKVQNENKSSRLKLLWYGPVYPWYKPEKLLEVAQYLTNTDIDFVGIKHPRYENTYNRFFKKFFDTNSETKNLNVIEDFCDNPSELYRNYDAGIVLARDWLEEKYSSRGRILDMLSHGLPVIFNRENAFFMELSYLPDSIYPTSSNTLRKDITRFENNKSILKVSDKSHKLLQDNLSWDVVTEPLIDYIRRFAHDGQ
jgi:hypothetical protein